MKDEGWIPAKVYEFNTLSAIFASVGAGLGVTLFPESCVQILQQADALTVLEVPEKYAVVPICFVYRRDSFPSGAMGSFLHAL